MTQSNKKPWQIWIDVGGTFTDCLARSPEGQAYATKVLSSSSSKFSWRAATKKGDTFRLADLKGATNDFWVGYESCWQDDSGTTIAVDRVIRSGADGTLGFEEMNDTSRLARAANLELRCPSPSPIFAARRLLNLPLSVPLPPLQMFLGTTRGTNALLTRRGARTVLVTTQGFRDLLEIGEQDRPNLFDLDIRKPIPLAEQVIEVTERLNADGEVLRHLDQNQAREQLAAAKASGIESVAICLMHSFRNPQHEMQVAAIAAELGFSEISCSSVVPSLIKIVPRSETTILNAYLNPVIRAYADQIQSRLAPGSHLQFMTSAGTLVSRERFSGKDSVLSGPAGGVVGFARVAEQAGFSRAIGFDMGGTSTDVARYDGSFDQEFETRKANVRILTPVMAIETVAAGGGSICDVNGSRLTVGPDSATSDPGPACYGRGGPLAVTDLNVFLGRISDAHFPFELDRKAIGRRLDEIRQRVTEATGRSMTHEELALGFLEIANHNMATAIRTVSVARGYDPQEYLLVAFGGAGPQHATSVADQLGIPQVLVHPHSSVLSAAGIQLADRGAAVAKAILQIASPEQFRKLEAEWEELTHQAVNRLVADGLPQDSIEVQRSLDLRFVGTEPFINIPVLGNVDVQDAFLKKHRQLFGYVQNRRIEVVSIRVEAKVPGNRLPCHATPERHQPVMASAHQHFVSKGVAAESPRFDWRDLCVGDQVTGPALIADDLTTVVVDRGWQGTLLASRAILLERTVISNDHRSKLNPASDLENVVTVQFDPVQLEIFSNQFMSIARQMGITLQRTSVSVNIKDRLDFSCAIFDSTGALIVNAPHIPVHLGAMSESVRSVIRGNPDVQDGDVFVTNDPYAGGSHLPDVTVVSPVFVRGRLAFWVASRGHHAEIGGKTPGSMPPDATCLADEGVLIQNLRLVAAGEDRFDDLEKLLRSGPFPSRNVPDNLSDVRAQVAANRSGAIALIELVETQGLNMVSAYMGFLLDAAESQVRAALVEIPDGQYSFQDRMDNGKKIVVSIQKKHDRIRIDFSGTDPVSNDNLNANRAICMAAIMYVMRCLLKSSLPLNEGVVRPVELVLPECFLNPSPGIDAAHSPAIVGGNVETSQRIVDVLLGALQIAAASQGTMNNWLMGDDSFGYYETLGGGSGGTPNQPGANAVHTHMSNTRLTDPEVLEARYPVRLIEFGVAHGSGGPGLHPGGCGMIRAVEFLKPLTVSLLTSRRNSQPYGMAGGGPGQSGENLFRKKNQTNFSSLPSRVRLDVEVGDQLKIITPGGGGWGRDD